MTQPDPTETFRQEARELLEQLEQALLDLDHRPDDDDLVGSAFRALHTIKGSGAMFGFDRVAGFTHHVENTFDLVRKGQLTVSPEMIRLALSAKDHLRTLLENPEEASEAVEKSILDGFRGFQQGPDAAAPAVAAQSAAPAGPARWRIGMRLARNAIAMGTNPLLLLDELRGLGEASIAARDDGVPPLGELDPTECHIGWDILLQTDQPRSAIEDVFMFVIDDMQLSIEPVAEAATAPTTASPASAPPADPSPAAAAPPAAPPASPPARRAEDAAGAAPARREAAPSQGSVRVPAERLDELMDRVGELVIAQSRLRQLASASTDAHLRSVAEEIERLALEMRDTTMGMRTVPVGQLFGRFRRLVHDLARELGKEIELVTSGEETELDKTVIDRLNDPLVHLIRNSLDHGLETPEIRLENGKPSLGRILLSAQHTGAQVRISITDDGRGLDQARIRARAEERGLVTPDQVMTDQEIFHLIFEAGFSTAAAVTSISGRGVGMDVVKRAIEALRGSIDITSTPGRGTVVTLCLPLTLAIIDGLLVRVGEGRYVIPLAAVEECVELPAEAEGSTRCNFLNLRGELIPFLRLREVLSCTAPPERWQKVVIVAAGEQRVGLVLDQVIGGHQTVIKSLSRLHADVEMFSGATILGDGGVALILDIAQLVAFGQALDERLLSAA